MIDTHCHIQTEQFDADREEVIASAMRQGVTHFIVPAIDYESFARTLDISAEHKNIYCGLGIHPHSAKEWNTEIRTQIQEQIIKNPKVVAIGEIGLDYYYDFCPKDIQIQAFREQIELAIATKKPIIIHTRDSIDETLDIIAEYYQSGSEQGIFGQFHCFSGTVEQMQRAVSLGFCVSYTGNITFKNTNLTEVVRQTPEGRILIETDSPYLAPVPLRGKRNSPEHLGLVAGKIAEIKEKDIQEIMTLTTTNAKRLFLGAMMLLFFIFFIPKISKAQVGGKPPDSVMTKERRENEELIKKQRDELLRAQEERKRDSIRSAQQEQDEALRDAREQARKDSIRAIEKMAEDERARLKAKTPIAWKAIGIGAGGGVGNLSDVLQNNRVVLAPTSVFAYSFSLGTAITRGIDFDFSYNSFQFGDDFTRDNLYKDSINLPPVGFNPKDKIPKFYYVPTHEDMKTQYLSFDFRFVVNPRSPVKFYLGLGYTHVTISNSQIYHRVDSIGTGVINSPDSLLIGSFTRGGIKALFGARYDLEIGTNFILTPYIQIGSAFLFSGGNQKSGFDFYDFSDPMVFTHLNIGATLYFGWFGVARH